MKEVVLGHHTSSDDVGIAVLLLLITINSCPYIVFAQHDSRRNFDADLPSPNI